jgi:MoxR-like ATPase
MTDGIRCLVCGHEERDYLANHLLEAHSITVPAYLKAHPGAPTMSERLMKAFEERNKKSNIRRDHPPKPSELVDTFAGTEFQVWGNVPASVCLSRPSHYRTPTAGELGEDITHLALALADETAPAVFIHGEAGCGKDAAIHEFSGKFRRPALLESVVPGTDIQSWFFSKEFNEHGTYMAEGPMLKALRDGYTCDDGTVYPYIILITDFDRADRAQAEYLRLITDSIEGRVMGPNGKVFKVLEGTRVIATANSAGAGDTRGRYVSANPLDASILDRFEVGLQFHQMVWKDEEHVVRAKFPLLQQKVPGIFQIMGRITTALRKAIKEEVLYAEFSHRALCAIMRHATRLVARKGVAIPDDLIKQAARVWVDKLPDDDTRLEAWSTMDPHIKGGALGTGGTRTTKTGKSNLAAGFK